MTIRHLKLSLAALTAVCPVVCNAWPAQASLDACVNAFEKTLASSADVSPAFRVVRGHAEFSSSIADYYQTSYTFELQANNFKTGAVLARVRCSADRHGSVALTSLLDPAQAPARVAQR